MGDNVLYKVTIQRKKTKLVTTWYISAPEVSTSGDVELLRIFDDLVYALEYSGNGGYKTQFDILQIEHLGEVVELKKDPKEEKQ